MKTCLTNIKNVYKTIPFTHKIEMCKNGCFAFSDEADEECPPCHTKRNKADRTFLNTVSIPDKVAQLLAIDETRDMIKNYRANFEHDGNYKDVFSGGIYKEMKEKLGMFKNDHDVLIGLGVDAFSSKSGRQSLVMISTIVFSIDPLER